MPQTAQVSGASREEAKPVDHYRDHVAECRDGNFDGFDCLVEAVTKGRISALDVGTTDAEIQEFRETRIMRDGELAVEYLAEARAGEFGNFLKLVGILDRQPTVRIRLELETEEYHVLIGQHNVRACVGIVEDCRNEEYGKLPELVGLLERRTIQVREIGTTEEEILSFVVGQYLQAGRRVVEQCRTGDYANLIPLLHDIRNGTFSETDVGTTPEEVEEFRQAGIGRALGVIAEQCRAGNYHGLSSLTALLKTLPDGEFPGVDFDAEEVSRWERLATLTGVRINRSESGLILA